jgi:hypothetical protein
MAEASCTKYGPILRRFEWDCRVYSALGAGDLCLDSTLPSATPPLSLALLAAFRFVSESLPLKEFLFSRRKHKHLAAIGAFQLPVSQIHGRSSRMGEESKCAPVLGKGQLNRSQPITAKRTAVVQ